MGAHTFVEAAAMPGKFVFNLDKPEKFNKAAYLAAIKDTRKLKHPSEIYSSYGPEEMGVGMVIKVQHKPEWSVVLPSDPNKYPLECGFSYGIVSRKTIWQYVQAVLVGVCRSSPGAFVFSYEDGDLGDIKEVGYFDYERDEFVVTHQGLPSAADFETASGNHHQQQQGH